MPGKKKDFDIEVECCKAPKCCDMRGMLSFLIMHLLSKKKMYGSEIADEIAARKGDKPNPGTLYPTLKYMEKKGLIERARSARDRRVVTARATRKALQLLSRLDAPVRDSAKQLMAGLSAQELETLSALLERLRA